jgi:hypothetical protein
MTYKTKKYIKKRLRGGRTLNENISMLGSIGLQMGEAFLFYIVNTLASMIGVDPNKSLDSTMSDIFNNIETLERVLQSPEGQLLLANISEIIKIITKEVVSPAITELGDDLTEKGGKMLQHATQALMNTLEEIPGPGTILGIIRTLTNLINMAKEGTAMGEQFLHTTNDIRSKLNEKKGEFDSLVSSFTNLMNMPLDMGVDGLNELTNMATQHVSKQSNRLSNALNTGSNMLNTGLNAGTNILNTGSNMLNTGSNMLNTGSNMLNTGSNMLNTGLNTGLNNGFNTGFNNGFNTGFNNGYNTNQNNTSNMNNLNTVGNIVGGRLSDTLSEFIKPKKSQHGGGITKKHHIFSRSMTKRHH